MTNPKIATCINEIPLFSKIDILGNPQKRSAESYKQDVLDMVMQRIVEKEKWFKKSFPQGTIEGKYAQGEELRELFNITDLMLDDFKKRIKQ